MEHDGSSPKPEGGRWPQPRGGFVVLKTWDSQDMAQTHPSKLCKPWSPTKIPSQTVGHTIIYSCRKKRGKGMFQKSNFSLSAGKAPPSQKLGSSSLQSINEAVPSPFPDPHYLYISLGT